MSDDARPQPSRHPWAQKLAARKARYQRRGPLYRAGWVAAGTLVTLAGLAMLITPGPALVVIPVGLAMLALEFSWAERALEKALVSVRPRYDYILIDTPPSLGLLTINALVAANGVIVPVQCEYLSLRGLVQLQNTLTMIQENLNPNVDIHGILATMYDRRLVHSREAVDILRETFGDLVFNTKIRKTIRYAEAPVRGQSVLTYDPTGEAAALYRDLAKEVLNGAKAREHA
jgi:cellulose biosynthesis protein BcsQ